MKSLRDRVMAYPPEDRLDVALMLLDELSGEDRLCAALMRRFGLSKTEARVVAVINARAPAIATKQVLYAAIYGDSNDVDPKIFDIYISHIRKKMPGLILTAWGRGWFMANKMSLPDIEALPNDPTENVTWLVTHGQHLNAPWTADDDAELVRMVNNGSTWAAIEDELGRSRRACQYRLGCLVAKKRRVANA